MLNHDVIMTSLIQYLGKMRHHDITNLPTILHDVLDVVMDDVCMYLFSGQMVGRDSGAKVCSNTCLTLSISIDLHCYRKTYYNDLH